MKITNEEAKKMLKKARAYRVAESVDEYPDNERDGRDDFQVIADETGWMLEKWTGAGWCPAEELEEAKKIVKRTTGGRVPIEIETLEPIWKEWEIKQAKELVNEYNRTKNLMKRLNQMGYYSQW